MFRLTQRVLRLCSDMQRIRCVDAINETVLNHKDQGELLKDSIMRALSSMQKSGQIGRDVYEEMDQIFNPLKGVSIQKMTLNQQQERFSAGKNKLSLFPFCPNSTLMKLVTGQFYQYNLENSNEILQTPHGTVLNYYVGTPGLGKSVAYFMLKYLHDIKVRACFRKGVLPFSERITVHYKFFYMHSKTELLEIVKQIKREIKNDFGNGYQDVDTLSLLDFQKLKQSDQHQAFKKWLANIVWIYETKGFLVRFIIDQINELYKLSKSKRMVFVENWNILQFTGCKPLTFVSSRNNKFLSRSEDPIMYIALSDQNFKKIVLDNLFTPSERLIYSYESIFFELQKSGLSKQKAIAVLKQTNIESFATRLVIREAISLTNINDSMKEKKISSDLNSNLNSRSSQAEAKFRKTFQQIIGNIPLEQFERLYQKAGKTHKTTSQQSKYEIQCCLNTAISLFEFSVKDVKTAPVQIKIKVDQKQFIKKQIRVLRKPIPLQYQQFYELANFLFIGRQENNQLFLMSTMSQKDMRNFRIGFWNKYQKNDQIIQRITADDQQKPRWQKIINSGIVLEDLIKDAFISNGKILNQQQIECSATLTIVQKQITEITSKVPVWTKTPIYLNDDDKKKSKQFSNELPKIVQQLISADTVIMRAKDSNMSFDFLVTHKSKQALKLFLVDMTISVKSKVSKKKITDFYSKLLKQENFQKLIKQLIEANKNNVEIFYYVLNVPRSRDDIQNRRNELNNLLKDSQGTFAQSSKKFIDEVHKLQSTQKSKEKPTNEKGASVSESSQQPIDKMDSAKTISIDHFEGFLGETFLIINSQDMSGLTERINTIINVCRKNNKENNQQQSQQSEQSDNID